MTNIEYLRAMSRAFVEAMGEKILIDPDWKAKADTVLTENPNDSDSDILWKVREATKSLANAFDVAVYIAEARGTPAQELPEGAERIVLQYRQMLGLPDDPTTH